MGVRPRFDPTAVLLQPLDDEPVRLLIGDELAFQLRPAASNPAERSVGRHRIHEREAILLPRGVVVGAEGGRHVHEPRSLIGAHKRTRHDDRALALLR